MNKIVKKTFLSWTIYSAISVAVIILLCIKYVIILDILSQIFLVIITFVFFVGLYFSYKQQVILYNEQQSMLNPKEENATIGKSIINKMERQYSDAGFNMPKEYTKIYQSRIGEHLDSINSIANILITLGFVFTVYGLILSIGELKAAIASTTNTAALLEQMNGVLAGVDTSFYTTLFGAICGGISLKINLIIHNNMLTKLVDQMRLALLKIYSKHNSRSYSEEYKDLLLKHDAFQKLLAIINNNMDIMSKNITKLSEGFQSLTKNLNTTATDISATAESAANRIDYLSGSLKGFFKDIYQLNKSVERIQPLFSESSHTISKDITKISDKLLPGLSSNMEIFTNYLDKTSNATKNLEASMKDLIALPIQKRLELVVETIEKNNEIIKEAILNQKKQ